MTITVRRKIRQAKVSLYLSTAEGEALCEFHRVVAIPELATIECVQRLCRQAIVEIEDVVDTLVEQLEE